MYGILQFSELKYEESSKITAAFDASGPGDVFKVNANTSLEQVFKSSKSKLSIRYSERGGGAAALPTDRVSLGKSYSELPERAKNNERPLFLTVVRYSSLSIRVSNSYSRSLFEYGVVNKTSFTISDTTARFL